MSRVTLFANPRHGVPGLVVLPEAGFRRAAAGLRAWPGHDATPLLEQPGLAARAGIGGLWVKAEAGRFGGIGAKAPGAAHAVARLLLATLSRRGMLLPDAAALRQGGAAAGLTVAAIGGTDWARAVIWAARACGAGAVAILPAAEDAAGLEAPLHRAEGEAALALAADRGWLPARALSVPGETELPRDAMQGLRLMAQEALEAMPAPPSHVVVPAVSGAAAAAVATQLRAQGQGAARLVTVQAGAAGLLHSAQAGAPAPGVGLLAWQELERSAFAFLALAQAGLPGGTQGLLAAAADPAARAALGLGADSRVLAFDLRDPLRDGS